MIRQLHPSLKQLVQNVDQIATEADLLQSIASKETIRIASDGGAIPGRASYGWVIQIGDTQIAKGKGPTFGDDPRSFRAEGYGMASALLYLRLLQREYGIKRDNTTTNMLICDNEGLLIRVEKANEWTYITPNVTLRAEWDVESVILDVLTELKMQFTFQHVLSHQDDDTPVENLTLETRLNVEADRLATEYMQEDLIRRPTVALFPTAKAQLLIKDVSVTRKIPQSIRFAAGSGPIQAYLMERNKWTRQTLDTIHWEAHGASHSHHRSQRCYLIKLCHRHIPIGQTLNRRNRKYSPICPGCRVEPEDQHHYLLCNAPSRISWRIDVLANLRRQLRHTRTNEHLNETIIDCIDKALAGRAIPLTGPFQSTLKSQARIGWLGLLRGYWCKTWQKEYEKTYEVPRDETRKDKNKRHLQMGRWQKQLIQTLWTSMIVLWTTRNAERHGWDAESKESAKRELLHKELEAIYDRKHQYPRRVQRLLRGSYEIHIQETVTKLADWLDAYKGTFAVTWAPD